ncbi:lipoyl(octanoyl) transferase LipB [Amycolatopsis alkalitolerans]|uniref:Octanoyltransferase n=1 Tax=Amycolatopsis alkalitolerans TaxID=2547244 RepID=A0A5C4LYU1_9PSEU|nr:lipoyl(octanoyl) transferase LipB [Amycolatopsis alkalitolerans]TNC23448.1 lipoyl(octanoyl) transferase LipB [Amycolatopsis alkalitolerans]
MRVFPGLTRVDLGEVPYREAAEAMRGWVAECQDGAVGDRLFLLSHPPVVTYGPRTSPADLPVSGLPAVEVDRGGQATYHGPGQIVGYLVAHVRERGPADVVRWLEHGIIDALATLGFEAVRRETPPGGASLVGVWTPDARKIASIGMRIRRGVSSHGFSLNVDPDMSVFGTFVSCGLSDPITSLRELADEAHRPVPGTAAVRDALATALGATPR